MIAASTWLFLSFLALLILCGSLKCVQSWLRLHRVKRDSIRVTMRRSADAEIQLGNMTSLIADGTLTLSMLICSRALAVTFRQSLGFIVSPVM